MRKPLSPDFRADRDRNRPARPVAGNPGRQDNKVLYLAKQRPRPAADGEKVIRISDERLDLLANRYLAADAVRRRGTSFEDYLWENGVRSIC